MSWFTTRTQCQLSVNSFSCLKIPLTIGKGTMAPRFLGGQGLWGIPNRPSTSYVKGQPDLQLSNKIHGVCSIHDAQRVLLQTLYPWQSTKDSVRFKQDWLYGWVPCIMTFLPDFRCGPREHLDVIFCWYSRWRTWCFVQSSWSEWQKI